MTDLTAAQRDALRQYLDSLDERTRQRGLRYFEKDRVKNLENYKRGVGVRAEVTGTKLYRVKLRLAEGEWEGECSCPVMFDCKHCVAVALLALAAGGETAGEMPPEPLVVVQAEPPKRSADAKVVVLMADRLGRKLSVEEKRAVDAVDKLFEWHRGAGFIAETMLEPITRLRAGWGWNSVQVWPEEPRTPWEAWLYVAAYLRRTKHSCPPALLGATDWTEVEALTAEWERRQQVEQWRGVLHDLAERSESAPAETVALRVRLEAKGMQLEWRKAGAPDFAPIKANAFTQLATTAQQGQLPLDEPSLAVWRVFYTGYDCRAFRDYTERDTARVLNQMLRLPGFEERVVGPTGTPLARAAEQLQWRLDTAGRERIDYRIALVLPDGSAPPPALTVIDGTPSLYVTETTVFSGPPLGRLAPTAGAITVPAEALETSDGLTLLERIGVEPPPRIAGRVRTVRWRAVFHCAVKKDAFGDGERLLLKVTAESADGTVLASYLRDEWTAAPIAPDAPGTLTRHDRGALRLVPELVEALRVTWDAYGSHWHRPMGKNFAAQFTEWLAALPDGVTLELDPLLDSLRGAPIAAQVKLEVEEAGIDWFDLRVALDVTDTTLTPQEIAMLLDARGGFVRLGAKGWRRLQFQLSEDDEKQLADLGLNARDFSSEPQRLHALQLAGKKAARRMLPEPQALAIERRANEIQTRVMPELPAGLLAELRPYQREGFHFLAYLSTNRFGGILADDMGLGKTVQTLAWLLWLRAQPDFAGRASLVVCPKSVTDNWLAEGAKFAPGLRVKVLAKGPAAEADLKVARTGADLVVLNYAQLRGLQSALTAAPWHAVILDEAQYIKNPDSQTAKAAWALRTEHRLALSGTPIENRLLDLWSIMGFAMPGVLGKRAAFAKSFDQRSDPFARTRLAARVRPFVLRRTKGEVAKDLPERSEEDILCELEGEQATLYRAELKRARAALLNINTSKELDKKRFNILTSLLRLRQICCHPALVSAKAANAESAKLAALFDVLEPIIAEGHKVLVFSQFIQMLDIIRTEIERREWSHFLLTGGTEDRGALVQNFQQSEGAAVFLISLRAGGFGLNLTAASYVVLYDPWWNPAVENQAIDRTHRIGQTSHVIAYRLLVKESIEEKIRTLQRSKSALAADILGEESFTRALTLDDFRFLLGE
ncbi:MAG: DEAD/DEAH box helicase [Chthoniobacter sp.]|nr:DEAD/DEAH box helicase [Chthoniobacter sp.]